MCHISTPGHLNILYLMVPSFPREAFLFLLRAQKPTAQRPKSPLNRNSYPTWPRHDYFNVYVQQSSLLFLALWQSLLLTLPEVVQGFFLFFFFSFPLTREYFNSVGVPLVTEVALPLTLALWNGYSQVLDHNPHTITKVMVFKQCDCKREPGDSLGKERWESSCIER